MTITAETLKGFPCFRKIDDKILNKIASLSGAQAFKKGDYLIAEGKAADKVILLQEGSADLYCDVMDIPSGGGEERVPIQTLSKGELIGWSWLNPPYEWRFDVICKTDCDAVVIDAAQLRALMEKEHEVGYPVLKAIIEVVSKRLNATRFKLAVPSGKPFSEAEGG